jgi:hypothetical protein
MAGEHHNNGHFIPEASGQFVIASLRIETVYGELK